MYRRLMMLLGILALATSACASTGARADRDASRLRPE